MARSSAVRDAITGIGTNVVVRTGMLGIVADAGSLLGVFHIALHSTVSITTIHRKL